MRAAGGRSIYEGDEPIFAGETDYYQDESTIEAARDKLQWVRGMSAGGGALLDVGANFGYFVKEAGAAFDATGIEPSPSVVEWARTHLHARLEVGTIYDPPSDFRGRFDVVTMFDVIEHLADPRAALQRCRDCLTPEGRLYLSTPDCGSVMARLLGNQWYYIDLIQHISLFSETNLRRLLTETGFEVTGTRTFGRRYRFSYIERRLRQLAADTPILRAAHAASLPLRLWPHARLALNLRDVIGIAARVR
jgi:2-polyprenyl-3-methyl-5-hydroxy-6-metoxy-1,4-benzoquinol methylase